MKKRVLITVLLTLCLLGLVASNASANRDGRTQIINPVGGGMYGSITQIAWLKSTDVPISQLNITATDGSFIYNSGPIYHSNPALNVGVHVLPQHVVDSMPRGVGLSLYIEDYHYTGGSYTGWSSDQIFFALTP